MKMAHKSFFFLALSLLLSTKGTWSITVPPVVEDIPKFTSYEDMQNYFDIRNARGVRLIENPTGDTYIDAFNMHNEQYEEQHRRIRRSGVESKELPNEPTLIKFEISDAVEPSDEVKEIIRKHQSREERKFDTTSEKDEEIGQRGKNKKEKAKEETRDKNRLLVRKHRSREMKVVEEAVETSEGSVDSTSELQQGKPKRKSKSSKRKSKSRKSSRVKRSLNQQPANFKVQMIPFEISDAREPDEHTKLHMIRMRAMDFEKAKLLATTEQMEKQVRNPSFTTQRSTRSLQYYNLPNRNLHKRKVKPISMRIKHSRRQRRSAPQTPPEMIKFEIEDAKEPSEAFKTDVQRAQRDSKDMHFFHNSSQSNEQLDMASGEKGGDDQNTHESRRRYVYKEAPIKTKKSLQSLPRDVQKVIGHLLKENDGAKAYVKYIPSQKYDLDHKKVYHTSKLPYSSFGAKIQPMYSMKPAEPVNQEPSVAYYQHVPVVQKIRYVFTPVPVPVPSPPAQETEAYVHQQQVQQVKMAEPIVVPEPQPEKYSEPVPEPVPVYHQQPERPSQPIYKIAAPLQFKPSKPDPYYESNQLAEINPHNHYQHYHSEPEPETVHYKSLSNPPEDLLSFGKAHLELLSNNYQSEVQKPAPLQAPVPAPSPATPYSHSHSPPPRPLVKIEYHAPPDSLKENYKDLEEFQELSSLMGKSPEDQIHGLTYLIAKEMQSKLKSQRQQKKLEEEQQPYPRPQDNTAPIQFHSVHPTRPPFKPVTDHSSLGVQPGRLIGMAKAKEYIPIVENSGASEQKPTFPTYAKSSLKLIEPPKAPYKHEFFGLGLSANYEGVHHGQSQRPEEVLKESYTPQSVISQKAPQDFKYPNGYVPTHVQYQRPQELLKETYVPQPAVSQKEPQELQYRKEYIAKLGKEEEEEAHQRVLNKESDKMQYASKYAFGYRIRDFHTGNDFGHKETHDLHGVTRGEYHILLPDGRIQNVIYHADDSGFHADVSFETGH